MENLRAIYPLIPAKCPLPTVELKPDMIWLLNRLGWSEKMHDAILSEGWCYTKLKFTTIKGADHAWCAMIDATAQWENGFDPPMSAGAARGVGWPEQCKLQTNCSVVIKHGPGHPLAGHYHRTRCFAAEPLKGIFWGLGGNQNDEINIQPYPIDDVVYCFMPQLKQTEG